MNEKIVAVSSYGLFCLSVDSFSAFLRAHKIRTKKVAVFLDKNRPILEEALKAGCLLPVSQINSVDYVIQVSEGPHSFPDSWVEVLHLDNCNLVVGADAAVWVGSMGGLDKWSPADYEKKESISYRTLENRLLFQAYKFRVKPGAYKVTLRGFKRRQLVAFPAANYGFAYELHPADNLESFANPLVEEVNIAKM